MVGSTLLGLGIHDEVADHAAHPAPGQWDDQGRQQRSEAGADAEGQPVEWSEKTGKFAGGDEAGQFAGGRPVVAVAGHTVDEAHREGHPVGVGDESGESVSEGPFAAGLVGGGQVDPAGCEGDGVFGESVGRISGVDAERGAFRRRRSGRLGHVHSLRERPPSVLYDRGPDDVRIGQFSPARS